MYEVHSLYASWAPRNIIRTTESKFVFRKLPLSWSVLEGRLFHFFPCFPLMNCNLRNPGKRTFLWTNYKIPHQKLGNEYIAYHTLSKPSQNTLRGYVPRFWRVSNQGVSTVGKREQVKDRRCRQKGQSKRRHCATHSGVWYIASCEHDWHRQKQSEIHVCEGNLCHKEVCDADSFESTWFLELRKKNNTVVHFQVDRALKANWECCSGGTTSALSQRWLRRSEGSICEGVCVTRKSGDTNSFESAWFPELQKKHNRSFPCWQRTQHKRGNGLTHSAIMYNVPQMCCIPVSSFNVMSDWGGTNCFCEAGLCRKEVKNTKSFGATHDSVWFSVRPKKDHCFFMHTPGSRKWVINRERLTEEGLTAYISICGNEAPRDQKYC